jgi:hypothetical protein
MDRRKFWTFLGLGGLFAATPEIAKAATPKPKGGVIIFWINVGLLPPHKAMAFVERMKEQMGPAPEGWQRYFFPIRPPQDSKVEVFFADHDKGQAEKIIAEMKNADILPSRDENYWADLRKQTKDYCLLMLGAPVVRIELDDQQLDLCWDKSTQWFDSFFQQEKACSLYLFNHVPEQGIKDLTLGYAMTILGRIRRMYQAPPGPNGPIMMDGEQLVQEGKEKINQAKQEAWDRYGKDS